MEVQITVKGIVVVVEVSSTQVELLQSALLAGPRKSFKAVASPKPIVRRPKAKYVPVSGSIRRKAMQMAKELTLATGKSVSMSSCISKLTA